MSEWDEDLRQRVEWVRRKVSPHQGGERAKEGAIDCAFSGARVV